jgi:hypothetical protein
MTKKLEENAPSHEMEAGAVVATLPGDTTNDKLLKRNEVAEILGTSVSTVRRMEGSTLRPIVGERGEHLFHEEHVRELVVQRTRVTSQGPDTYDGPTAAVAFELFDAGHGPVEVVKRMKLDPRAARALHREWADLRGGFFVGAEASAKVERIGFLNDSMPVTSGEELVRVLTECDVEQCACCRRRVPHFCPSCVVARRPAVERLANAQRAGQQDKMQVRAARSVTRSSTAAARDAGRVAHGGEARAQQEVARADERREGRE